MITHAQLEINIPNLKHNYLYFRSKLKPETKLLVLIKANSYGHGALPFASTMESMGANYFAVATLSEGIELKKGGIKNPVIILSDGYYSHLDVINAGLEPAVTSMVSIERFTAALKNSGKKNYPIHLKLDTGMHRLGFRTREIPWLLYYLQDHPEIEVKSIYSHLASSDAPEDDDFTRGQVALFDQMSREIMEILPNTPFRHILNSAGVERFPEYQFDMVRLGIGIYGISALDDSLLKPTAFFRCPIIQIERLYEDEGTVGYGRHGILNSGYSAIATLPVGYADGIDRRLGRGNVSFEVNGNMVKTIGNICMDMCMIDITGTNAKMGDIVTIFGDKPTARDLANILGTIPYEIFTSVSHRIERVVKW